MADPITFPITTDPADLEAVAFDYLEAQIPGWSRARADAMSQLISSCARLIAEGRDTASEAPVAINRYEAVTVDGLLPLNATAAQTTATVTALDDEGYAIDAGTRFEVRTSGDTGVVFATVGSVTIAPGLTSTGVGEVALVAETPGASGSGLPALSEVVPVDALAWIDTVTLTALTTGGVDAETDEEHLARWIEYRRLSRRTPVLAEHFAAIAKLLVPSVGRALGLDNYNPADDTSNNERMVTVAVTDSTGEPVSSGVKTDVDALLQGLRETNFIVHVIDATYTTISVTTAFTTYPGFDPDSVEAAVLAALAAFLSPATANNPPNLPPSSDEEWVPDDAIRYLDLADVVKIEGVHKITSLLLGRVRTVTGVASTDVLTSTAHGYVLDDPVLFAGLVGGAPLVNATTYFARDITTNTFKVSLTVGGAAINITTDITAGTVVSLQAEDVALAGPAGLPRAGELTAAGTAP